jgi:uncharacterized Zn ribbon protein
MQLPQCQECGAQFIRHRYDHKFCCYDCSQSWHRREYRKVRDWYRAEQAEKQKILSGLKAQQEETAQA